MCELCRRNGRRKDPIQLNPEESAMLVGMCKNSSLYNPLRRKELTQDLKANQNFMELQAQLEGTENRIKVERDRYNEAVKMFNVQIRRFPTNILASIFGFDKRSMFEAQEGAEAAPVVEF